MARFKDEIELNASSDTSWSNPSIPKHSLCGETQLKVERRKMRTGGVWDTLPYSIL
jgi:hypothetical protein